jgi:hypothetical protein
VCVQAHGPGAGRNFPGESISELPVTVGEERKGADQQPSRQQLRAAGGGGWGGGSNQTNGLQQSVEAPGVAWYNNLVGS